MSSSSSVGEFNLDTVSVRKPLEFPDGTVQSTAYTGGTGVETLEDVLTAGNNANGLSINNVGSVYINNQTTATAPQPDLQVVTSNGFGLFVVPNCSNDAYNPIVGNGDVVLTSSGNKIVTVTTSSTSTCGLRILPSSLTIGCGGTLSTPSQGITFNTTPDTMTLLYNNLSISTGALPNTTGSSAGLYLPVNINGVNYKIPLNLA